jgi:mRNA interferase MazF
LVARGDIIWADLGGTSGQRPVCVLTRDAAIQVLSAVTCAPITRTIRGIRSEVEVGPEEGLPEVSVITCDNIVTLPIGMLASSRVGYLSLEKRAELDHALRYALDIQY